MIGWKLTFKDCLDKGVFTFTRPPAFWNSTVVCLDVIVGHYLLLIFIIASYCGLFLNNLCKYWVNQTVSIPDSCNRNTADTELSFFIWWPFMSVTTASTNVFRFCRRDSSVWKTLFCTVRSNTSFFWSVPTNGFSSSSSEDESLG